MDRAMEALIARGEALCAEARQIRRDTSDVIEHTIQFRERLKTDLREFEVDMLALLRAAVSLHRSQQLFWELERSRRGGGRMTHEVRIRGGLTATWTMVLAA
jgi:hypothetical protein